MGSTPTPIVPKKFLLPFLLVTLLFPLWGFANNFTDPFVKVFKDVFVISNAQSSWVQMAFYGGYATMAIPAALFIRRFSYKVGILVGLSFFALGSFLTIPAALGVNFNLFILSLYILTFGLAFLETTANPFILSMGPEKTATQRLNFAQAFNPFGSLLGAYIAASVILANLDVAAFKQDIISTQQELAPTQNAADSLPILPLLKADQAASLKDPEVRHYLESMDQVSEATTDGALAALRDGEIASFAGKSFRDMQLHDLELASTAYATLGAIVLAVLLVFLLTKIPHTRPDASDHELHLKATASRLLKNPRYVWGVISQMFYVGAQIMVWTFIFHYCENELGIDNATAGKHQLAALALFLAFRFICTFFLKFIRPSKLLALLATAGIACTLGAIYLPGMPGLYSLMAISACMSLMFPTIYGIALEGVGEDAKLGSAGLILAIVGAVWLTRFQAKILDMDQFMGVSATRGSFYLSVLCFLIIACYGWFCAKPKSPAPRQP